MTRIVAGLAKGRRLAVAAEGTRPTSDRAREGLFNSLASQLELDGARVLDLFAGTGAVGLEALSRGARAAVFVESGRAQAEVLRRNIDAVALPGATIRRRPVADYLADIHPAARPDTSAARADTSAARADTSAARADTSDSGPDTSDSGRDASDSGRDASDSGRDASDSGRDASDSGRDASDSGRDASDSGPDASDSGPDASDSGSAEDGTFDLAFADPPYALTDDELGPILAALADDAWLVPGAVVVVERSARSGPPPWPAGIQSGKDRRYGDGVLWYGRRR